MRAISRHFWSPLASVWAIAILLSTIAFGQDFNGGFGGFPSLGDPAQFGQQPITFEAKWELEEGSKKGRVSLTATTSGDWYIYSVTQPKGGPLRTVIELDSKVAKLAGLFQSDKPPKVVKSKEYKDVLLEEHFGTIVWTAPIELSDVADPDKLELTLVVSGQTCMEHGACQPINDEKVVAKYAGAYKPVVVSSEGFRDKNGHVLWTATLSSAQVVAGGKLDVTLSAKPEGTYHIYPFRAGDEQTDFRTLIVATDKGGFRFSEPTVSPAPIEKALIPGEPKIAMHEGDVQWKIPIEIPATVAPGKYQLGGLIGYQACTDVSCDQPLGVRFAGEVEVVEKVEKSEPVVLGMVGTKFSEVANHPNLTSWIDGDVVVSQVEPISALDLLAFVGMALLGGLILNFMPCVLPVIGLKLMGFVEKGGKVSTKRVETLDLFFIFGIMSVIWILAALTIFATQLFGTTFNWGEQFTIIEFKVAITVLVFAMALSFLGVWEIPIPGFAMSQKSGELMQQEGPAGAYFKGFFTTLLATPCSGPFLGLVFGACIGRPWYIILLLYSAVGLGLSSPYIVIAIRPSLLWWLPKPGPWMNTLKEVMAFPLLFTVVFLVSTINQDYRVAMLTLLIGVWFACWLIGQVPGYAELNRRLQVWVAGGAIIAACGFASFTYFGPSEKQLPWEPYSEERLAQLQAEEKTVLLEFTADWCLTCKYNLRTAIETEEVAALVKSNNVVALLADWSDQSPEIKKKINELGKASIPLLAIYPSSPGSKAIVLEDALTETMVLEALQAAGPSKTSEESSSSLANTLPK